MNSVIVFISGAYSSNPEANTELAKQHLNEVLRAGFNVFCPHTNYAHTDVISQPEILDCCLKFLQKCDCLLMLPNWEMSKGACIEHDFAKNLGMNVFYSLKELQTYYELKEIEEL